MGVGIGLGCAEFPFSGAAAYWRWIDMCEAGGVDGFAFHFGSRDAPSVGKTMDGYAKRTGRDADQHTGSVGVLTG